MIKRHGMSAHPLYAIWYSMIYRCENKKHFAYDRYGGRGIKVCERWHDLKMFTEDMGERPSRAHTLDRIDNNGDYEPGNCRWATYREQHENRHNTMNVTINGETHCVDEWARRSGVSGTAIRERIWMGMEPEKVFSTPLDPSRKLTADAVRSIRSRLSSGETREALAREYGITRCTMWRVATRRIWRDVA